MILIRRYRPDDRKAVRALHELALRQTGAFNESPEARVWDADLDDIQGRYLAPGGEFLVGEIDDIVVAMGGLLVIDNEKGQIKRMRVHTRHQRRGYGRSILLDLETRAAEHGLTALCLDTSPSQVAAIALYASHGYHEVGREERAGLQMIFMEKTLSPG